MMIIAILAGRNTVDDKWQKLDGVSKNFSVNLLASCASTGPVCCVAQAFPSPIAYSASSRIRIHWSYHTSDNDYISSRLAFAAILFLLISFRFVAVLLLEVIAQLLHVTLINDSDSAREQSCRVQIHEDHIAWCSCTCLLLESTHMTSITLCALTSLSFFFNSLLDTSIGFRIALTIFSIVPGAVLLFPIKIR